MENIDPKFTRVSALLALIPSLDEEDNWHFPLSRIDQRILEAKKAIGTEVHAAIAVDPIASGSILTDRAFPYVNSFKHWEKAMQLEIISREQRFYNDAMSLTGCVDMIAKFGPSDPLPHIIDFKCTVSADHKKWALQAAFYHFLASQSGKELSDMAYFVQLDSTGGDPKVHQYKITNVLMQHAFSLYNFYNYVAGNWTYS